MLPIMQVNISWCTGVKRPWAFSSALLCSLWNWACQYLLGVTNFLEQNYFSVLFMAWLWIGVGEESSVDRKEAVLILEMLKYWSYSGNMHQIHHCQSQSWCLIQIHRIYAHYFSGVHAGVRVCILCLLECRTSRFSTRSHCLACQECVWVRRGRKAARVCCVLVSLRRGRQTFPGFLSSFAKKESVTIFPPNLQM